MAFAAWVQKESWRSVKMATNGEVRGRVGFMDLGDLGSALGSVEGD